MSDWFWAALAVLALWGGITIVRRARERAEETDLHGAAKAAPPRSADDEIDWEELERAEREVRDLEHDGGGRPTDEGVGDDWGPGAGKTPVG